MKEAENSIISYHLVLSDRKEKERKISIRRVPSYMATFVYLHKCIDCRTSLHGENFFSGNYYEISSNRETGQHSALVDYPLSFHTF